MVLFKKRLLKLVLQGQKTQTRRLHRHRLRTGKIYQLKDNYYGRAQGFIKIKRRFDQRLGDMTEEEARAEGVKDLADFRELWKSINGDFNPNKVVTVYEFELAEDSSKPPNCSSRLRLKPPTVPPN